MGLDRRPCFFFFVGGWFVGFASWALLILLISLKAISTSAEPPSRLRSRGVLDVFFFFVGLCGLCIVGLTFVF